ncbi:MAG: hypothetical protein RI907_256 [Pseudomonadota bacterium]|jgi:peptidyl-prolyl cis-trans isomerase C
MKRLIALALMGALVSGCATGPQVTDAEARAEYDRIVATKKLQEFKLRHILVATRHEADIALLRIKRGEDFGKVAREVSKDEGSVQEGGELGWNIPTNFTPEFAKVLESLSPRGMTEQPVASRFGWHVIEVTETRPKAPPPYEVLKDAIIQRLKKKKSAPGSFSS